LVKEGEEKKEGLATLSAGYSPAGQELLPLIKGD
jgi:hypothetical protein